jgi:putative membrane protein
MIHRKRSLSTLTAIAVAVGLSACGGSSRQTQANAPSQGQMMAPSNEQYGSAMGQPSGATPATTEAAPPYGAQPGTQVPSNPPPSGAMGGTGTMGATTPSPYGGQGTMGSPSGQMSTGPETGGQYGGSQYGTGSSATTGAGGTTGGMTGTTGGTTMGGGTSDVSTFDDAQLAAIVQALNMSEMQLAQFAEAKASSPEVKRYAHDMMVQHREMQNRANSVFTRMQITPNDNAVSNQLKTDAQSDMSALQGMRGKDFDREYMDMQVRAHNHAMELMDRMMASAKSPELKAELQSARTKVEARLRQAERIEQTLQKGTTSKQRGGSTPTR